MDSLLDSPSPARRWIVVVGVVVLVWALKWAQVVLLPIVASLFLIGLVYPVYRWTDARAPGALAVLAAFLTVVAGFALFFGVTGWAIASVAQQLPEYESELRQGYERLRALAGSAGVSLPPPSELAGGDGRAGQVLQSVGGSVQTFVTGLLLVLAFVALGLPEVTGYARKLDGTGGLGAQVAGAARELGHTFRAYVGAVTVSAAITAVLTAALCLVVGLEFALVFALLSFLMNYVPTIGSVIAIVPPTLFALVQFGGAGRPLLVFFGFAVIELTVGNYVAPKIEGRILQIAPTIVLAAILFWGWLWGVVGALLAVPLTIALAVFCHRFDSARWVSTLVRDADEA